MRLAASGSIAGMGGRLPLFVALLVALFVGAVPLRECWAFASNESGVVAVGAHAHAEVDADAHDGCEGGREGVCDHDADHAPDHDGDACCVDAPFHVVSSVAPVSADRGHDTGASVLVAACAAWPVVSARAEASGHPPAPPDVREPVPTGLISTVLLR